MTTRNEFVSEMYRAGLAAGLTDPAARVMAAQAAIESDYGRKPAGDHNYFGIKAGSNWSGATKNLTTHEVVNGKRIKINDKFRAYATPEEGIADRVAFMAAKFPAFNSAQSMGDALDALQNGKYGKYYTAPQSEYEGIVNYVNSNFLDGPPVPPSGIGSQSSGGDASSIQQALSQRGFSPGPIDGVNGPLTKSAIKAFQQANGLVVDGIAGPKTLAALGNNPRPRTQPQPLPGVAAKPFEPLPFPGQLQAPSIAPPQPQAFPPNPMQRPAMPQIAAAPKPLPTAGGFDPLGSALSFLGDKANAAKDAIGSTVAGAGAALGNTANSAADLLKNELIGTVKGRTLLFNTLLGVKPASPTKYGETFADRQFAAQQRAAMAEGRPIPQRPVTPLPMVARPPLNGRVTQPLPKRQQTRAERFTNLDQFGMII